MSLPIGKYFRHDFDKLLAEIKEQHDNAIETVRRYQKELSEWNKDEEIQAAKDLAKHYRDHSLIQLTSLEQTRINKFKQRHLEYCKNGSKWRFELTGTGIGTAITICCPVCGEEENITDYDCW